MLADFMDHSGGDDKVFEMQTAAIRYELGDHHEFEFVEGTISHAIAPEIEPLVSKHFLPGRENCI